MKAWVLDMLAIVVGVMIAELALDALRRSGQPGPLQQSASECF